MDADRLRFARAVATDSNTESVSHDESHAVLVVDDHPLVRIALRQALRQQPQVSCVLTAGDYPEGEAIAMRESPRIIFLDTGIGHRSSINSIVRIKEISPGSSIVAMADAEDIDEAIDTLMAGAQGYRSKQEIGPDEVADMVAVVLQGELVVRPLLLAELVNRMRRAVLPFWSAENSRGQHTGRGLSGANLMTELTTREREVLQLVCLGHRDREIARRLHISEKTAQKHVQNILGKLGAENRTAAAHIGHIHMVMSAS